MNLNKYLLVAISMTFVLPLAYGDAVDTANQSINTSCASEITATGCAGKKGHALMKCFGAYKTANPSAQVSDACVAAMQKFQVEHHRNKIGRGSAAPAAPTQGKK